MFWLNKSSTAKLKGLIQTLSSWKHVALWPWPSFWKIYSSATKFYYNPDWKVSVPLHPFLTFSLSFKIVWSLPSKCKIVLFLSTVKRLFLNRTTRSPFLRHLLEAKIDVRLYIQFQNIVNLDPRQATLTIGTRLLVWLRLTETSWQFERGF